MTYAAMATTTIATTAAPIQIRRDRRCWRSACCWCAPRRLKAAQLSEPGQSECDERIVHVAAVLAARAALPGGAATRELTNLFAALGDPTRLRIMAALATQELCVCDLAATIGQTES